MKRWEQLPRKALAFCLAVLCFAGAAVMGCYQYANGEAIWSDGGNWADSYAVRSLERRDEAQLHLLANLWMRQQGTAQGTSTDGYYQQRVGQIQRQLSAEATNLRWQILWGEKQVLSNCAKYALGGTRVYVDLQVHSDCAVLTVKNISRQPLNMEAGRLMERFVRGDASRTEEGSGLGLSIAQSLTELQQGRFQLEIDGDLFKASVTLPITGREQEALPPVESD